MKNETKMETTTRALASEKTETEILIFLLSHALDNDLPIAFWRLPHADQRHLVISRQYNAIPRTAPIEDLPEGFLFAPFDKDKDQLFLPGDYLFTFENGRLKDPQTPVESTSATWLNDNLRSSPEGSRLNKFPATQNIPAPVDFLDLVNKSIRAVEQEQFEKVVPSRFRLIDLPEDFEAVRSFENLCHRYPNALVSFVSIPGVGHWIGATPEPLVSVANKTIFKTVALAGTMAFREGMSLRSIAWTQKEIEEQALVERYVISCFKKIRLREYEEHGPKTVVAGNLVHLKSDFTVDMKATNFPQLGSVMLQLLHPTSAVCGMPLEPAMEFLRQHEGYDREFYAGYLGPVNINNNIDLFVNLRCMKLLHNKAQLFAGAGITIDSLPEKEWEETEMKFDTLLNVIF